MRESIEDFEGGFIFDIISLKFFEKPNDFDKGLSFIKFTEINGYKTIYRLWYNNVVYDLANQQLGIYLYLYLFKKIRDDNYKSCLSEKGWANSGKELDEKDKAPKLSNIILYDRNKKYLAVPLNCRLPRYLSIGVALLNGKRPEIEYLNIQGIRHKGMYFIYKNTPILFIRNTVNLKLSQRIIEVNIN